MNYHIHFLFWSVTCRKVGSLSETSIDAANICLNWNVVQLMMVFQNPSQKFECLLLRGGQLKRQLGKDSSIIKIVAFCCVWRFC